MDTNPRQQAVQLEMDKFGMEKELSKLKSRLIERELSWPQYQSFKSQLLQNRSEKQYFSEMNQQISRLKQHKEWQKRKEDHHRQMRHHFFFAGMLFFFIAALVVGWYQGWAGVQGFTIKEFAEPNVFLDKMVYQVGESVYIHVLPKEIPYMLTVIKEEETFTPIAQVFIPQEPGNYQLQVMMEWKTELRKVEISFQVE